MSRSLLKIDGALLLCLWTVARVLTISGIEHIRSPWFFLVNVFRYEIFGGYLAIILANLLPVAQLTIAAMIFSKNGRLYALWAAAVLFGTFSFAQIFALARGLNINCGCFGSYSEPISIMSIGLDVALLVGSILCAINTKLTSGNVSSI